MDAVEVWRRIAVNADLLDRDRPRAEAEASALLPYAERCGDLRAVAMVCNTLSIFAAEHSDWKRSVDFAVRVQAAGREVGDEGVIALGLTRHGYAAAMTGDSLTAELLLESAVSLLNGLPVEVVFHFRAEALQRLGHAQLVLGKHDAADRSANEAMSYRSRGLLDQRVAEILTLLGDIQLQVHRPRAARALYEESIQIHRAHSDFIGLSNAQRGMGVCVMLLGDFDEGLGHLRQAEKAGRAVPDDWCIGMALEDIAAAEWHSLALNDALRTAEAALGYLHRSGYQPAIDRVESMIAALREIATPDPRNRAVMGQLRDAARKSGSRQHLALLSGVSSTLQKFAGKAESAFDDAVTAAVHIDLVRRDLSGASDRESAFGANRDYYLEVFRLAAAAVEAAPYRRKQIGVTLLEVAEMARADSVAASLRQAGESATTGASPELARLVRELNELEASPSSDGAAVADQTARISAVLEAINQQVSGRMSASLRGMTATGAELIEALNGSVALIYELDADRRVLHRLVARAPDIVEYDFVRLGVDVWAILLGLADPHLAGDILRRTDWLPAMSEALVPRALDMELQLVERPLGLLVVPIGPLWFVPFDALVVSDGRRLIEVACCQRGLSLSSSMSLPEVRGVESALAVFDPSLGSASLGPEIEAVRSHWGDGAVQFVIEGLLGQLGALADVDMLAISAHGDAAPGLEQCLFFGGRPWLTAGRLLTVRLPPVLAIGACSSGAIGMEKGREPIGVLSCALLAGSSVVLASTHPTPNLPGFTGDILGALYDKVGGGMIVADALRLAKLEYLATSDDFDAPYWWASYFVCGRPAPKEQM